MLSIAVVLLMSALDVSLKALLLVLLPELLPRHATSPVSSVSMPLSLLILPSSIFLLSTGYLAVF